MTQLTMFDYTDDFTTFVVEFFEGVARRAPPRVELTFQGKTLGVWDRRNRTYTIRRDPKKHFFRKFQSYGVSEAILKGLRAQGVRAVILMEHGRSGDIRYGTHIQRFFNSKLHIRNESYPYEHQLHLALKDWKVLTGRWKLEDVWNRDGKEDL